MLNLDTRALNKAIEASWQDVLEQVSESMHAVIEDPQAFADLGFSNQDIVLTNRLNESQTLDRQGLTATWTWDPVDPQTDYPYAAAVYGGFQAYGGPKYVPGRNWPQRGIERARVADTLCQSLRSRGLNARVTEQRSLL